MRPLQFDEKLLAIIRKCKPAGCGVFIIGGAVRDAILDKKTHDFDFGVTGSPEELARCVADRSGGRYFLLDDKRKTCRVILPKGDYPFGRLDFTFLVDGDLEKDLRQRDFTINAMAVDIDETKKIIDPLNGIADIRASRLRECSVNSFATDPVRVLRAARFHVQNGFSIEKNMAARIEQAAVQLSRVSGERKRDELFRMTQKPGFSLALKLLAEWKVFPNYLSPVKDLIIFDEEVEGRDKIWDHTLNTVRWTEYLLSFFFGRQDPPPSEAGKPVTDALEKFRFLVRKHLEQDKNIERDRIGLIKVAALFHEIGKPASRTIDWDGKIHFYGHETESEGIAKGLAKKLALSNWESRYIQIIVRNQSVVPTSSLSERKISREQVYDYFQRTGDGGIDCCLIALACQLANVPHLHPAVPLNFLAGVSALFDAWFHHRNDMISPVKFLSGEDVIKILKVKPGPWIGYALKTIERAQASGLIDTRDSARKYLLEMDQPRRQNQSHS